MCRWICLLTLAVLMLFSASQADSLVIPCCSNYSSRKIHVIRECYEQKPRRNCDHAFVIKNKKGQWCIKPDVAWLQEKIKTGKIRCPPDLTF